MPPIKINHIAVVVEDVNTALEFWQKALGLPPHHVEHNEDEEVKRAIGKILQDNDYKMVASLRCDDIYINRRLI